MKIKIVRQSGRPIELEDLNSFLAEYKEAHDRCEEEAGRDMGKFQELFLPEEKKLAIKYGSERTVNFPSSKKSIEKFIEKYGNYTIIKDHRKDDLVLVIMDEGF
jgi:hypothetical protein